MCLNHVACDTPQSKGNEEGELFGGRGETTRRPVRRQENGPAETCGPSPGPGTVRGQGQGQGRLQRTQRPDQLDGPDVVTRWVCVEEAAEEEARLRQRTQEAAHLTMKMGGPPRGTGAAPRNRLSKDSCPPQGSRLRKP